MSVIGIDFGSESCYIAVARAGGIETIANDYSLRNTPSYVGFTGKERVLGVAAKNAAVSNLRNTVFGFKKLLGRKFKDPRAQDEIQNLPFTVVETADGGIGIKVSYLEEDNVFTPLQITAMLLTKLKIIAESALSVVVNDCVISCPSYYTDCERRALLDAAAVAGLNVLRLFNETTATALTYGIYKQDLPALEEKPRNVVFVDVGYSSLQVAACAFNKGKLKMLATSFDDRLGGRDFDRLLADHFCADFKQRFKLDVKSNKRAMQRLFAEVEKLKKQMSANTSMLPMNIECFMEERDVSGKMCREEMEKMSGHLFKRVETALHSCLQSSGLKLEDINAVEIVGGSTRIPHIKELIQKVYGQCPSTTLNQDEAVSRGCALMCAILSPTFKVREFSITDCQLFPVGLSWGSASETGDMEVFEQFHATPFSKLLSFYRKEPFVLRAAYSSNVPVPDPYIGQFKVTNVQPTPEGESVKVKVKVRVDLHGVFKVASASIKESVKEEPMDTTAADIEVENSASNEKMDVEADKQTNGQEDQEMKTEEKKTDAAASPQNKEGEKKKVTTKTIDLPIESDTLQLSKTALDDYMQKEGEMKAWDRKEKERVDAKNAVEEYVYEMRDKLSDYLQQYVSDKDREVLTKMLTDTEDWLYEDGENCGKKVYTDKLDSLKSHGEPIKMRYLEAQDRPKAIDMLSLGCQLVRKALDLYRAGEERYSHIEQSDMDKVEKIVGEKEKWLEEKRSMVMKTPIYQNPPVLAQQFLDEKKLLESVCNPILNKSKPKPPPEPEKPTDEQPTAAGDGTATEQQMETQ